MSEPDDQVQEEGQLDMGQPPGELLAQAREARGFSRVRVSELLGLTQAAIRDIELSRFEKFPSGIYVRGYIRNYCKLVAADENKVLEAYDCHGKTHEIPEESPFGSALPDTKKSNGKRVIIVVTLVALAAIAIASALWFL